MHQMHALHDHPYLHNAYGDHLRHISYFLSPVTRPAFANGDCDLVPAHFSEMPLMLRRETKRPLVLAAASPPDRHGYVSLGTNADYTARFIGQVPFFIEVNPNMPRTFGENSLHLSQVVGWTEVDYPLIEVPPPPASERDRQIAALVAERVPDGATIQAGIGAIPNAILGLLHDHRDLGLHTELISDGVMDLFESGALTGTRKVTRPGKLVATFALGTRRLYDFLQRQQRGRVPARRLGERSARHRSRALLRVDQRDRRGRPPRAVQLGDDRRAATTPAAAGRRTSRAARCTASGDGFRRAALDDRRRIRLAHRLPTLPGRAGHDDEEHGRSRRHRVRRRRAARPVDRATSRSTHPDRAPEVPRHAPRRSSRTRFPSLTGERAPESASGSVRQPRLRRRPAMGTTFRCRKGVYRRVSGV